MKIYRNLLFIVIAIGSLFLVSIPAFASSSVTIGGTAEVVNTLGILDFDGHNSNVGVDSSTGDVTGYVWSEDLGWIDFDNNGGAGSVNINLENGQVSGSAYVVNTGGTIDFTNFNSNVIVDLENNTVSGYAWSSDLGWIDFSGVQISGSLLAVTGQNILPIFSQILFAAVVLIAVSKKVKTKLN